MRGHASITELLVHAGASITKKDAFDMSPLHLSCYHLHPGVIQRLLSLGADPNSPSTTDEDLSKDEIEQNEKDVNGNQKVTGSTKGAKRLPPLYMLAGLNFATYDPELTMAAACCRELLNAGANVEGFGIESGKMTPLHYICKFSKDSFRAVKVLIKRGADVNAKCAGGLTPLHIAVSHNQGCIIEALLDCEKCNVNETNDDGNTALMLACKFGHKYAVEFLIKKASNMNVDILNKEGLTAVDIAINNGYTFAETIRSAFREVRTLLPKFTVYLFIFSFLIGKRAL